MREDPAVGPAMREGHSAVATRFRCALAAGVLTAMALVLLCPCAITEEVYEAEPAPMRTDDGVVYASQGRRVETRVRTARGVWDLIQPRDPFAPAFGGTVRSAAVA